MPYRDLPPDFAEQHNSVWVDVPSELFDPAKAHVMYNDGSTSSRPPQTRATTASASTSTTRTPTA